MYLLSGKRVALVGTGASSMQIGPAVAGEVEHLTVFQRSPAWIAPVREVQQADPGGALGPDGRRPFYQAWYWARLFWEFGDKVIDALRIDPDWTHPDRSVNARNDGHREFFTRYLTEQLAGRPDLIEKSLPPYPPTASGSCSTTAGSRCCAARTSPWSAKPSSESRPPNSSPSPATATPPT